MSSIISPLGTAVINLTIAPLTAVGVGIGDNTAAQLKFADLIVARDKVTMVATVTGAPTSFSLNLEGSLDGLTWEVLGTLTQASAPLALHSTGKAYTKFRANLTAIAGGTSPTVSALFAASG